jgi:uncharacterized membrane protein YhaH (DUF805 family)
MNWYAQVMKKYAEFSGRARRKEYWMFVLFNIIFIFATILLDNVFGTTFKFNSGYGSEAFPYGWLYTLYVLAVIIPGLAVSVRRLHDLGKSGWMILIALIPFIGGIWLLVLYCTEGQKGENQYGPDPKAEEIQ